nr:O-antigen ligase family protein [uncultured Duganella sp.]
MPDAIPEAPPPRARDRLKALPLLVLLASAGLPIGYTLAPSRTMLVADVADMTYAAASSASMLGSLGNLLLLGGLYAWSGAMLLGRPRSVALVLGRSWPLLLLMLLLAASLLWSALPEKVAMNVVHNLGVILVALAGALHYRHRPETLPRDVGLVLGLNMALQVAAVALAPQFAVDWQARWQGLTVHPNTLGALGFTTLWANASALAVGSGRRGALAGAHLAGCTLAVMAMVGADSVTSKMSAALALLLVLAMRSLARRGASRRVYLGLALGAAVAALLYKLVAGMVELDWLFALLGRDSKLTGRDEVWRDAYQAIGAKPLLGWSFDDHAYLIASAGMPYSSYHNGVLDLAVNGGLLAVLLLALVLLNWALAYLRRGLLAARCAPFAPAFVLAYMVHNLTEASYVSPRGQMWVLFLALLFLGACGVPRAAAVDPTGCRHAAR